MPLMNEAMTKDDFDRREKGLPPLKKERNTPPDPVKPAVENEIRMTDIPDGYEVHLEFAKRSTVRNEEGIMFIGFDVSIELFPIKQKQKPGRPKKSDDDPLEPMSLNGWMIEGEFLAFVRTYRKQIDQQVIHW